MNFFKSLVKLTKTIRDSKNKRISKKFLVSISQKHYYYQVVIEAMNASSARLIAEQMFPKSRITGVYDFRG